MNKFQQLLRSEKLIVLFDQCLFSGTAFITTMLLARRLTPTEFGLFSGITLSIYLLLSLSNALIIQPLQVTLSKIDNRKKYLLFSLYFQLLVLIVFLLLILLVFQFNLTASFQQYLLPVSIFSFGFLFHDFFRKTFLATGNCINTLAIDLLTTGLQLVLLFTNYLSEEPNLYNTLFYLAISYVPSILYSISKFESSKITSSELLEYVNINFKQGSWLTLVSILQWSSSNFFTLVSGMYLGLEALGAFRIVQSIFGILNIFLQAFENYALPKASQLYSLNTNDSKTYLKKITYQGAILFAPILICLFIFSKEMLLIFGGEKYITYSYAVKLMTVLYVIIYLGYPIRMGIRILVVNQTFFVGYLISFIFSLLSFQFLLSNGQLAGAIIGLALNQLLMLSYWQYNLKHKNFSIWK